MFSHKINCRFISTPFCHFVQSMETLKCKRLPNASFCFLKIPVLLRSVYNVCLFGLFRIFSLSSSSKISKNDFGINITLQNT